MDDLKISHQEPAVIGEDIALLSAKYVQVGEMAVRRGKKHDYLGMTLDFSKDGKFVIDMEGYLDNILNGLPEDIYEMATTPPEDHLFKTCNSVPILHKEIAELFQRVTAQTLCVTQRCWMITDMVLVIDHTGPSTGPDS